MIAWFITKYEEDLAAKPSPKRWCAMDKYSSIIFADGGNWEEIEVGANHAIVKVKASLNTLQTIALEFTRISISVLDDSLSSLTNAQKTKLLTLLNDMGYTNQEIQNSLSNNIATKTLRQLLKFITSRRIPPRFDKITQQIVFDLPSVDCSHDLDKLDRRIQ